MGALPLSKNRLQPSQVFSRFLNPQTSPDHSRSVVIHGLLPNAQGRIYHEEVSALKDFLAVCGGKVLVGHHLAFDRGMIDRALKRHGSGPLLNQGIDTAQLAKRLSPSGYWRPADAYALEVLARRYQIELSDRHTAVGDSYITAMLFLKLCSRLSERKGRGLTLDDLMSK
jgi:DNA polymerase-3 subunit epsilon